MISPDVPEVLLLLLPVAALSGWLIGRRERRGRSEAQRRELPADYFHGLNYVLNEQPDRAIEAFTRLVEVDPETAETHLALGNLFRRRGEVDRAIRIHQNLMARPSLDRDERTYALLELGRDYMRAGLLDRAVTLFREVVELNEHADTALRCLLTIYQREKDWEAAIDVAERLADRAGVSCAREIAHFCCEQAEQAYRAREPMAGVQAYYRRALRYDRACVRAMIGLGDLALEAGQLQVAKRSYKRVARQDISYLPEILDRLERCYGEEDRKTAFRRYLEALLDDDAGASVAIKLSELIVASDGRAAGLDFLASQLRSRPSITGINRLIDLTREELSDDAYRRRDMEVVGDLLASLAAERATYRCGGCGFEAHHLHWQCPSCRHWGTIKPARGG